MKARTLSMMVVRFVLCAGLASAEEPALRTAAEAEAELASEDEAVAGAAAPQVIATLRAPLFSPLFASTPVASVEDEPITFKDLIRIISVSHAGREETTTSARRDYGKLLDRVLTTRLIVAEARNIGLDELPEVKAQIDDFAKQRLLQNLMSRALRGAEPDPSEVDRLYRRMAREFLLTTLEFEKEEDALAFQEQYEAQGDFTQLAMRFFEEGRAKGELGAEEYVKLGDLLPAVARVADGLEVDSLSPIFRQGRGFLMFYVRDIRPHEDPDLREEARRRALEPLRRQRANDYTESLEQRYATIDEELMEEVNFEPRTTGLPFLRREQPVDYEALMSDDRVLATVHGDEPYTITVANLARRVKETFYHGEENTLPEGAERRKTTILHRMVLEQVLPMEAQRLGLDREEAYLDAVAENTEGILFEVFLRRVVAPDVAISEEELREYYDEHLSDFSTPKMVRLNGLAFDALPDAQGALDKLRRGADFQWVSANTRGHVDKEAEKVLDFDDVLLSVTSVPEDIRPVVQGARRGDALIYSAPDQNHYVILIAKVFPPQPRAYEEVRREIFRSISAEKIGGLVAEWGEKLREAYEPTIFLQELAE